MSKIQTIICLFIFIVIIFSVDSLIGNPFKESFKGSKDDIIGKKLNYKTIQNSNKINKMTVQNYLGVASIPRTFVNNSNDEPLYYGFPSSQKQNI